MKTLLKKYLCFSVLGFLLTGGVTSADASPYALPQATQDAGLIYSGRKDYAKYELFVGKMQYVESANGEGFQPTQKQLLVGSIDRRLYDYSVQKSAIQIYETTLASLKRKNYRILYQCSGDACGDAAGWRLFLSEKLGGDTGFQHYVVAAGEIASGSSHYLVLYVNDLAGQPRALLDVITVSNPSQSSGAAGSRASIYFKLGQSAVEDRAEQLARVRQFVESHRSDCPIQVIGYTDALGEESTNRVLAKARVDAVIQYLQDLKTLSPDCLVPDPRGVEVRAAPGPSRQSRRVDLELAARK